MPNTIVQYRASVTVAATSAAVTSAAIALIPLDLTLPQIYGLLPITDVIGGAGTNVTRTVQTQMTPTIADAAGTAVMNGGALASVTVTNQGGLYGMPPVLTFTGGNPTAPAQGIVLCKVRGCIVLLGGSGYTGATIVTFVGGLAPGGTAATGTVTVVAGAVTGIVMTNTGGPYLQAPFAVISDTGGGTGAEVVAGLSVDSVRVTYGGLAYKAAPTAVFTPLFKQMLPDSAGSANQGASLSAWMDGTLAQLLKLPVQSTITVS
jgi:hypothetical protein